MSTMVDCSNTTSPLRSFNQVGSLHEQNVCNPLRRNLQGTEPHGCSFMQYLLAERQECLQSQGAHQEQCERQPAPCHLGKAISHHNENGYQSSQPRNVRNECEDFEYCLRLEVASSNAIQLREDAKQHWRKSQPLGEVELAA